MRRISSGLAVAVIVGVACSGVYSAAANPPKNADIGKRLVAPDATKQRAGNGQVSGVVLLSPVCPVERNPPDPACAPRPYKTKMYIRNVLKGLVYRPVPTSTNGAFNLSLTPGRYLLRVAPPANGSMYPRCAELKVNVVGKETLKVTVNCDTGIR